MRGMPTLAGIASYLISLQPNLNAWRLEAPPTDGAEKSKEKAKNVLPLNFPVISDVLVAICRLSSPAFHQCALRAAREGEGAEVFFFAGDGQIHGVAIQVSGVAGRV